MNHYERIIYLLEGTIKKANKAKKGKYESDLGRTVDASTIDDNPENSIRRGVKAYRHSKKLTHRGREQAGVEAIQRGRFRDARRKDSSK